MKILVLASTYPLGAGDTTPGFVHELCKRLAARGHAVTVLTPHVPAALEFEELEGVRVRRFRYAPVPFEGLAGTGGIVSRLRERPLRVLLIVPFLLANAWAILRIVRREPPDIVHAHWLIPQGALAALLLPLLAKPSLVCTAHGGDLFALRAPAFRWLRRLVITRAARVTVVSRYMERVLRSEGAPDDRLTVASMGVDLRTRFVPVDGVTRESAHVIFVGRLVEKKGVHVLLDAFRIVNGRHPAARLSIVGDGPERADLERRVAELRLSDCVRFLGAQPQASLPALYASAAIAVVPSVIDRFGDQEGLGLVTIEAIGCGCTVVVSDLEAITDVVTDGETGLVTTAGDPTSLAAAVCRLLDDPGLRATLASHARHHALAHFDWDSVAARYSSLLAAVRNTSTGTPVEGAC